MILEDKTILIISPESWGTNFVSKHHYANYLARNNSVYFLNPVVKSHPLSRTDLDIQIINENLTVVNYSNPIPKLNLFPKFIQSTVYENLANQIQNILNIDRFDIIWSFDPYRFYNQKAWAANNYIYHAVDHHEKCFEEDMAKSSDLILVTAKSFRERLKLFNKNVHFTGHALDLDNFSNQSKLKVKLPGANNIKAGLVGNFNQMVDYDLIEKMVTKNENVDFIFVGPFQKSNLNTSRKNNNISNKINHLRQYNNAYFIGEIPAHNLTSWIKAFDINLILYKESFKYKAVNPHKVMGYLYSGKIIVSSWVDEYKNMDKSFIYMTESNNEIPEMIKSVANNLTYWNSENFMQERINHAVFNSYDEKIEDIATLI